MSADIIPFIRPRTLSDILEDIRRVTELHDAAELEWYRTRSDEASKRTADADSRRFDLQSEAMNMIAELTGVRWSVIAAHLD